jgi:hypothetical protein
MTERESRRPHAAAVAAAVLLTAIALVHLVLVPRYMDEHPVVAWLFIGDSLTAVVLAAGVLARRATALALGGVLAAVTAAGFILSRTTGMPGYRDDDWSESLAGIPLGVLSIVVEAALVVLALLMIAATARVRSLRRERGPRGGRDDIAA